MNFWGITQNWVMTAIILGDDSFFSLFIYDHTLYGFSTISGAIYIINLLY